MLSKRLLGVALAALVAAGCEETVRPAQTGKTVTPVYQGRHCGRTAAASRVTWIQDQAQLDDVFQKMRRTTIGSSTAPDVDFTAYALILIELGQRPTAGYQMRLASQRMVMDKGDGLITFSVETPGSYAAQVITSPCLLVSVPRGDYRSVRAISTDNAISVRTAVP